MTDDEIAEVLRRRIDGIETPRRSVRNDIVEVLPHAVVVCSHRTDRERRIPFSAIRNAEHTTTNGSVTRALHEAVFGILPTYQPTPRAARCVFAPSDPAPEGVESPEEMVAWYRSARAWVDANSDWARWVAWNRDPADLTADQFLSAYAWAVYVSGFKARTILVKWEALHEAWRNFEPSRVDDAARQAALGLIAHKSKTQAILAVARMVVAMKWPVFKANHLVGAESIGGLPWMGPTNRRFLARNLRLADVGKPDRWLVRFAERFGYRSVDEALGVIETATGDNNGLADVYIWAYLSEHPKALG